MRRLIRDISSVLIIAGILLVVDAGVTLVWQEPITALIGLIKRGEVDKQYLTQHLNKLDRNALASLRTVQLRIAYLARLDQREVATGAAIGQITIGKIGVDNEIVQGTDDATLEKGPGHYPSTAFPGLGRTVAIAGHRTTYLAPFRHLDSVGTGNTIVLKMPYATFTYVVQYRKIVAPTALYVIRNVGYDRLVLSACNPLYSAAQRIIVFARLQEVAPTGLAA